MYPQSQALKDRLLIHLSGIIDTQSQWLWSLSTHELLYADVRPLGSENSINRTCKFPLRRPNVVICDSYGPEEWDVDTWKAQQAVIH